MLEFLKLILASDVFWRWTIFAFVVFAVALIRRKDAWRKYEGLMIDAIKRAEKLVPESTSTRSLLRLKAALAMFAESYERIYGKPPSPELTQAVATNLPAVHDKLEATDTL